MSTALSLYTEEEHDEPTIICDMRAVVSTFMIPPPRPFYKQLDVTTDPGMPGRWRLLGLEPQGQDWVELMVDSSLDDCLASVSLYK